jgi:tetratricopeptide (TPR) repeat protein
MESPAIGSEGFDDFPQKRPRRPRVEPEPQLDENGEVIPVPEAEPQPEPKEPRRREREASDLPDAADLQRHAEKAVKRGRGPAVRDRKPLGARPQRVEDPAVVLKRLVGAERAKSLMRKLRDAGGAFQSERFTDSQTLLRPVVKEAPDLPDGRELMGLSYYRIGKWREAITELEAFRELTHSTDQHPVLADCHRALGRWNDVEAIWAELGEASPSSELITEGRIVVAGAQADQGDLVGAIRTLEQNWKLPKRPGDQHLRRAYALADFYDRAGKAARARELFKWISSNNPGFADVKSRVKALS